MENYIDVSPDAGRKFYQDFNGKGRVVMVNLLKFRKIADYSKAEGLRPQESISGEDAYALYMQHTLPHLKEAGSRVLYFGKCGNFLIGPTTKSWDAVLLVEHESVQKFIAFAQNEAYLKTAGHRTAALEDSRLLPTSQVKEL